MNKIKEMQIKLDIQITLLNSIEYQISNCEWALEEGTEEQKEETKYKINILTDIAEKITKI